MKEVHNSKEWFQIGKRYLDLGWSIIPVGKNKRPIIGKWKPFQNEQVTEKVLEQWCSMQSLHGFAVITGKLSGVYVLDIDNGSEFNLDTLPSTPCVETGSGGKHFYFVYPSNLDLRNKGGFQPKTDTRGEGGYAILPPAKHQSGNSYKWLISPETVPLAKIPNSLVEKLKTTPRKENLSQDNENIFQGVSESKRNDSATRVIGKLLQQFPQKDWNKEVWPLVKSWNQSNTPPLPESELLTTFNSIQRKALEEAPKRKGKNNIAGRLVSLVMDGDLELFLNQFGEPCITSPECGFIAYLLRSKKTERLLYKLYWDKYHQAPGAKAVTEAKSILEGQALFEKVQIRKLHNRIGSYEGNIYVDMGDNERVVHITPAGWTIEKTSPIFFQRFNHQKIQQTPTTGGDLKELLKLINVTSAENQLLLLVNLVIAFLPDIPRPILVLNGVPGSSKTTLLRFYREFIDPSSVPLVTPPKNIAELAQLASHNYVVNFDNLSYIKVWLSDALCRLVTGDGYAKRELWTDDDDILYAHKRVVGFCGINQVATKPDLLSRCVIIALEPINPAQRREESELWQTFNELKPEILGSIFDCLSYVIRVAPTLIIEQKPNRMADSFRYALAAAQFLGFTKQDLLRAYNSNTQSQHEEAIDASSVAQVIIDFMNDKDSWEGTSTQLHTELRDVAETLKVKFPKTPNWVWREINEVKLDLLAAGIKAERIKESKANKIILTKTENTAEDQLNELIEPINSGNMEVVEAEIPF